MTGDDTEPQGTGRVERRSRRAFRSRRWRGRTLLVVALVTAAAVGIGGWSLAAIQGRADTQEERAVEQEERAELSEANAREIAGEIHTACERQDAVADLLGDLCQQAEQIAEEPDQPALIGPTEEQLRPLVREYVDGWLAQNPPRDGRDGQTPTVAEIAAIVAIEVAAELAENPPPAGREGPPGRPPTAAELQPIVAQEVNAWLQANPPPTGPEGPAGPTGPAGADSTVPGPAGADGQPPHSWTTTRCDILGRCVTERCERTDPFDEQAPTYTCSEHES